MIQTLISVSAILSTSLFLGLESCQRKPLQDIPVTENVSFETHIRPITSSVCISCHSQGSRDYSRYQNAFMWRHSIYNRVVVSKTMPLGKPMTDEDRALFRDWVDQGANK